jgi:integrase
LEWTEIDFLDSTVTISKSLEQTKFGLRVKRPKSGKTRKFKLPPSATAALRFQQEKQAEYKRMFGADYKDLNLVFSQPDGSYLNPALVSQTIIRRMRKAGIKGASLHSLRHSHGSILLSEHVPLPTVSRRLGHTNTNITARIYAHALPSDDQPAANKWDEAVRSKPQ